MLNTKTNYTPNHSNRCLNYQKNTDMTHNIIICLSLRSNDANFPYACEASQQLQLLCVMIDETLTRHFQVGLINTIVKNNFYVLRRLHEYRR